MKEAIGFFFFFSSRRRHTRLVSDWSSDVCSSDLAGALRDLAEQERPGMALAFDEREDGEQAVPELLVGCRARVDALPQGLEQPRPRALHARPIQALLGAEVGVDHRLGDARRLRDRVDGRGVEPPLGERLLRDGEHLLLPNVTGYTTGAPCVRSHGSGWGHGGYITHRNLLAVTSGGATTVRNR